MDSYLKEFEFFSMLIFTFSISTGARYYWSKLQKLTDPNGDSREFYVCSGNLNLLYLPPKKKKELKFVMDWNPPSQIRIIVLFLDFPGDLGRKEWA